VETGTEKPSRRTAPSRAEPQVNVLRSSVPAHRHPPGPGHEWAFWSFAEATDPINQSTPSPPLVRCFWREVPTPEREREREEGGRGPLLPRRSCYSVSFVLPLRPHWYVSFHSHSLDFCLIFCGPFWGSKGPGWIFLG
jgi:hypothetical protein